MDVAPSSARILGLRGLHMERDLTVGSEWRAILFFSLPIMGSTFLQVMYQLADSLIVGNYIGPTALGAVGLTNSPTWLLLTFCTGIGTGTSIVVAQYYGAGRRRDIRVVTAAAYALSVAVCALLLIPSLWLAKPLMWGVLAAPPEMREMSVLYFRVYAAGILFQMLYNVTYGILRAHGDSRSGLLFLLVAASLNVLLDLLFVVVYRWGVGGAAAATVLSQAGCALASMLYLARVLPHLRPRLSFGMRARAKMRMIAGISAPIIAQSAIFAVGFTAMQRLVNSFGPPSIEGYAAMQRVELLAHIPSQSFNAAISAFAGQNVGAGKPERARAGYRAAMRMGAAVTVALGIAVIAASRPLLEMFNISGESLLRGREHLILLMIFMILSMTSNITSGFLQGVGDVRVTALASLASLSVRLIASYALARTFIDFRSIYVSMPPAWACGCLVVVLRYRSGKWRRAALR